MRTLLRLLWLLGRLAVALVQTWWVFLGEQEAEADDPDKEREEVD